MTWILNAVISVQTLLRGNALPFVSEASHVKSVNWVKMAFLPLHDRYTDQAYWVRATNKRDQLLEVLEAFDIEVKEGSLLSRCAKCNGTFHPRALTKAELPTTCVLSEGVASRHDCFYMCSNAECQKIYWQVSTAHLDCALHYVDHWHC